MPDPRHDLGRRGEDAAARWLVANSWTLLERRWRCAGGELDLVVLDPGGVLVGVEVKVRRTPRAGTGADAIDRRRLLRLRAALSEYARQRRVGTGLRVDLVSVEPAGERWRLRRVASIDAW